MIMVLPIFQEIYTKMRGLYFENIKCLQLHLAYWNNSQRLSYAVSSIEQQNAN